MSALHRHVIKMTSTLREMPANYFDYLRGEYKTLYRIFKGKVWPLLSEAQRSEWGVIFAMQHYGVPTRLMDWTESFTCALFFAQFKRQRGDDAAIWILNPELMNKLSIDQNGIVSFDEIVSEGDVVGNPWHPRYGDPGRDPGSIAIAPVISSDRMKAQQSVFTLAGDDFDPLEDQKAGAFVNRGALHKILLPADNYDEVSEFLHVAGLGPFTFFPDFEGYRLEHENRVIKSLRDIEKYWPEKLKVVPNKHPGPQAASSVESGESALRGSTRSAAQRRVARRTPT